MEEKHGDAEDVSDEKMEHEEVQGGSESVEMANPDSSEKPVSTAEFSSPMTSDTSGVEVGLRSTASTSELPSRAETVADDTMETAEESGGGAAATMETAEEPGGGGAAAATIETAEESGGGGAAATMETAEESSGAAAEFSSPSKKKFFGAIKNIFFSPSKTGGRKDSKSPERKAGKKSKLSKSISPPSKKPSHTAVDHSKAAGETSKESERGTDRKSGEKKGVVKAITERLSRMIAKTKSTSESANLISDEEMESIVEPPKDQTKSSAVPCDTDENVTTLRWADREISAPELSSVAGTAITGISSLCSSADADTKPSVGTISQEDIPSSIASLPDDEILDTEENKEMQSDEQAGFPADCEEPTLEVPAISISEHPAEDEEVDVEK